MYRRGIKLLTLVRSEYYGAGSNVRKFCYKTVKRPDFTNQNERISKSTINVNATSNESIDLTKQIRSKILATGPITVSEYMREVLTHPQAGYYMNRDVFGRDGDFITSPEISQIFGELVGIWMLNEWQKLGKPEFQFIELGPGRGTLARDLLKIFTHFNLDPIFSMHLVEISPHLSALQAQRLCHTHEDLNDSKSSYYKKGQTASGVQIYWYKQLDLVPRKFSIVLAHEFFDALPIHKLQLEENIWKEILIDVADADNNASNNNFRFVLSRGQTPISKLYQPLDGDNRQCLEYSVETDRIVGLLAERFETDGGFGLIVDYGHFGDKTDTFRAFRQHKLHDPLVQPGTADLTADVDFRQMKHVAEQKQQVVCYGPIEQGTFIYNMQGPVRLERLVHKASPEQEESLRNSYNMLTDPEKMGTRFKFFSLFPATVKDYLDKYPVAGF